MRLQCCLVQAQRSTLPVKPSLVSYCSPKESVDLTHREENTGRQNPQGTTVPRGGCREEGRGNVYQVLLLWNSTEPQPAHLRAPNGYSTTSKARLPPARSPNPLGYGSEAAAVQSWLQQSPGTKDTGGTGSQQGGLISSPLTTFSSNVNGQTSVSPRAIHLRITEPQKVLGRKGPLEVI